MENDLFYGMSDAGSLKPVDPAFADIESPKAMFERLLRLWSRETCAPRLRDRWTPERPMTGQCSVTSFLAQDVFDGEVMGMDLGDGTVHCFNRVGEIIFDLTNTQFGRKKLDYTHASVQSREVHFAKEEKRLRYELLKQGLMGQK